ncbi:hypothetical protein H6G65_00005, partial [Microcystis elabens FACHB-917]|nr:hypothetical protein [Microcystis elabens FACHB-917]
MSVAHHHRAGGARANCTQISGLLRSARIADRDDDIGIICQHGIQCRCSYSTAGQIGKRIGDTTIEISGDIGHTGNRLTLGRRCRIRHRGSGSCCNHHFGGIGHQGSRYFSCRTAHRLSVAHRHRAGGARANCTQISGLLRSARIADRDDDIGIIC